jgi:hypothetical protein
MSAILASMTRTNLAHMAEQGATAEELRASELMDADDNWIHPDTEAEQLKAAEQDELSTRLTNQSRNGAAIIAANRAAVAASGIKVEPKPERFYGSGTDDTEPMRPGQMGLFYRLLNELRTHNPDRESAARVWFESVKATLTKRQCSAGIDRLRSYLAAPANAPTMATAPGGVVVVPEPAPKAVWDAFTDVPNGYYAVRDAKVEGKIHYYRVSRSKSGQYVNIQEMASDTLYPVRPWSRAIEILKIIRERGPETAAILFGRTIGRCCRCGRTLTDADSRTAGIGPDCAGKGMF